MRKEFTVFLFFLCLTAALPAESSARGRNVSHLTTNPDNSWTSRSPSDGRQDYKSTGSADDDSAGTVAPKYDVTKNARENEDDVMESDEAENYDVAEDYYDYYGDYADYYDDNTESDDVMNSDESFDPDSEYNLEYNLDSSGEAEDAYRNQTFSRGRGGKKMHAFFQNFVLPITFFSFLWCDSISGDWCDGGRVFSEQS